MILEAYVAYMGTTTGTHTDQEHVHAYGIDDVSDEPNYNTELATN